MPKFFIFGDVHGYYDIFKKALFDAGYDPQNEDHWLISLGDNFDRGPSNKKMLEFLKNMKRLIMIKGNHETLLEDMIARGCYGAHDLSNGTLDTALQISGESADFTDLNLEVRPVLRQTRNYFETENYIFVHGWIALNCLDDCPKYWQCNREFIYDCDWRNFHDKEWEEARWQNGFRLAHEGLIEENKTIVCGHWHTSWPRAHYHGEPEFGEGANFEPYYDKGIIGIDACTAYSKKVNILVLEDNWLKEEEN